MLTAQIVTIVKEVCATIISVQLNSFGEVTVYNQCKGIAITEESFFCKNKRKISFAIKL